MNFKIPALFALLMFWATPAAGQTPVRVIDDFQTVPFSAIARVDGFNVFFGRDTNDVRLLGFRQLFRCIFAA
jgi:hypothetical protein